MQISDIRKRLREGAAVIGGWSTIADPMLCEAMASCGFHWQAVDMEHGAAGIERAAACFIAIERRQVLPLARIPNADPYLARRLLDCGAGGLIVSTVEDAEAFSGFAKHCHYPPHGKRGLGLSRCNLWGDNLASEIASFAPLLVAQIETVAGAEQADAIAAIPELDALFIGPYDLSASLGAPGDFTTSEFSRALESIRAAGSRHGKAVGIHQVDPDPARLRARIDEGYTFLGYGTDATAMREALGRPLEVVESKG